MTCYKALMPRLETVLFLMLLLKVYTCFELWKEFRTRGAPLQNVLYTRTPEGRDAVVVGGQNRLYKLSADNFSLEESCVAGPTNESLPCPSHPFLCDNKGATMESNNRVLMQLETDSLLLDCGTPRGMCSVHHLSHRLCTSEPMDRNLSVNCVPPKGSTVAFFGSGKNKDVLFVASTYNGLPTQYRLCGISARIPNKSDSFSLRSSTTADVPFANLAYNFSQPYRVGYVHGFSYNGFAYFVTVQNTDTSLQGSETRLVRVCESDPSFGTYTELPIGCPRKLDGRKSQATIAISASLEHTTDGSTHRSKVLAVSFGTPLDGMWGVYNPNSGSELCFFDMDSVEAAFNETIANCNMGSAKSKLIRFFGKNQLQVNCAANEEIAESKDACTPSVNSYIRGLVALIGRATLEFKEGIITSVTAMRQNGVTVAWVGDRFGYLHKIKLHSDSSKLLFWTDLSHGAESLPIEKSTALDRKGAYGYFLLGEKVVKFPVGSCSIYSSCSKCLRGHDDPLECGWCEGRCAHAGECPNGKKLEFNRCPVEVHTVYPRNGPITGGTMLTILGDNFGYWWREASNSIEIAVGGQQCQIINWVFTLVKCKTPPSKDATKVDIVISVNDTNRDAKKTYDVIDSHRIPSGFQYQVATLSGLLPEYGPKAGGTNITLRGENLDIGSQRVVEVGGSICRIHKFNETHVECSTSAIAADKVSQKMQVTMAIDGVSIPYTSNDDSSTKFTYMPNPVIDDISPRTANFSEEPTIVVSGVHLESVYKPRMVIEVASLDKNQFRRIVKGCQVLDYGQKMICKGPSLVEFSVISSSELEACRRKVLAHISFQMDGLHLPLKSAGTDGYFLFAYEPALLLESSDNQLPENKVAALTAVLPRYGPVAGGTNLTLFGINLDTGSERVVRIGDSYCEINSVSSAFLDCTTRAVPAREAHKIKRVTMTIDGAEVSFVSDAFLFTFTYKPDPVIYEIKPPEGIFSGLSIIDVRGNHLDSAATPFMVTHMTSFDHQEQDHTGGVCRVVADGKRMLCPIASVVGSCVTAVALMEEYEHRVVVEVSFRMDGVQMSPNGTGKEHPFYCSYQREPHVGQFPLDSPVDNVRNNIYFASLNSVQ